MTVNISDGWVPVVLVSRYVVGKRSDEVVEGGSDGDSVKGRETRRGRRQVEESNKTI